MTEAEKQKSENLFEGMTSIRAVFAAIESGMSDRKILKICYDRDKKKSRAGELSYLKAMSFKHKFPLIETSADAISEMALGTTHGGIICETTPRTIPVLSTDNLVSFCPSGNDRFFALIEGIEDPYNFGYAIRSLWAEGINALILSKRNWMSAAGVVCRASAGASEICPMFVEGEEHTIVPTMRALGVKIVSCDIKNSIPIGEADLRKPLLLAVGGEKRGLSREILDASESIVRLEYGRVFPQALSAASAAAIAGYEVLRQNS